MTVVALVFPNQLFDNSPVLDPSPDAIWMIEDTLFFGDAQYPARFHKQKLAWHRATMAAWQSAREAEGHTVYLQCYDGPESSLPALFAEPLGSRAQGRASWGTA